MEKCREEFENSLERTDGFHDGYVTWNVASGMYMTNDDDYECMADWMNGAFAIHRKMQAKVEELQKRLNSIPFEEIKEAIEGNAMLLYHEFSEDDAYEKAGRLTRILEQALKGNNHD